MPFDVYICLYVCWTRTNNRIFQLKKCNLLLYNLDISNITALFKPNQSPMCFCSLFNYAGYFARTWQHQSTKSLLWLFWLMSRYIGCQLSYDAFYIRLLKKAREGSQYTCIAYLGKLQFYTIPSNDWFSIESMEKCKLIY